MGILTDKTGSIVVSALSARANFGKLLDRVADQRGSLVIEKRGRPKAVLLSIRDYVKLAARSRKCCASSARNRSATGPIK
jgi:prevent-host-death family protein